MAVSDNPTKTMTIEKNWQREINFRWADFKRESIADLTDLNRALNVKFNFSMSDVRRYMGRFTARVTSLLTGFSAPNWQGKFQVQSYARGVKDFLSKLRSQGFGREKSPFELKELGLITQADFNKIIHRDALEFLTNRSFDSLKKWTDAMSIEVRQILTDAVIEGDSLETIIKNITDRMDVSRSRARVIAATEINQAYSRSSINEAIAQSEQLGEPVNLRWLTVRDPKVRHLHAEFHGQVMTPADASKNKSISPWNCRCGWAPVVGEQTDAQKERFGEQREQLLKLEQNNGN